MTVLRLRLLLRRLLLLARDTHLTELLRHATHLCWIRRRWRLISALGAVRSALPVAYRRLWCLAAISLLWVSLLRIGLLAMRRLLVCLRLRVLRISAVLWSSLLARVLGRWLLLIRIPSIRARS